MLMITKPGKDMSITNTRNPLYITPEAGYKGVYSTDVSTSAQCSFGQQRNLACKKYIHFNLKISHL